MKKGVYILFVFLLLIASCQKKNPFAEYPEWILGEWISLNEEFNFFHLGGINFISKDSCETRPGYLDDMPGPRPYAYYGSTTAYQIKNDTLKLFDLKEKYWKTYRIRFQSSDTMEISSQENRNFKMKYVRQIYPVSDENLFDQIIIDNDFFEMKTLSIDKNGNLFYLGKYRTFFDGLHTSEEGKRIFQQIELLFREANSRIQFIDTFPQKLKSIESWIIPTITFIKDHKMATIIGPVWGTDYIEFQDKEYCTSEFKWAYRQSLYLEQQMPLQPFDASKYALDSIFYTKDFPGFQFENNSNQVLGLSCSEYFYLWTELLQAKKVDIDFIPIYEVMCDGTNKYIQSDGRYFRYQTDKGETITLDLGFNFIEENQLGDKFEDRRKFIPK